MKRKRHIEIILKDGSDAWKKSVGYGKRWKVESTFSDMKRMFGDTIRAFNLYKECRIGIRRENGNTVPGCNVFHSNSIGRADRCDLSDRV